MRDPVAAVGSLIERSLTRRGASASEARGRRVEIREAIEVRARAMRGRRALWRAHRLVAVGAGRLEFGPIDVVGPGPGQVTVALEVSAISPGTERAQWLRLGNARPPFPFTPGYSGVGTVLAAADDVALSVGDRVAVLRTAYQSAVTMSADRAVPVPGDVEDEAAALTYLAVIAGHGIDVAGDLRGKRVAVVGLGTIGALALRLANTSSPTSLVGVAASRRREITTLESGATEFVTVDVDPTELEADVVIEATGDPDALTWAVLAARDGGTVVALGSPRGSGVFPVADVTRRGVRVVGAHISNLPALSKSSGRDLSRGLADHYLQSVGAGMFHVDDLIGSSRHPRELTLVYRQLAAGDITAAQIDWRMLDTAERHRRIRPLSNPLATSSSRGTDGPARPIEAKRSESEVADISVRERNPLRFGVIGCGDIGLTDARAIGSADNAEVVVCHDVIDASARALADAVGCRTAKSLDEALDPTLVDAIVISAPHDQHEPIAARAAAHGLHVVVEKPLAHDLASARRMVQTAETADTALSVCFPYRYSDGVAQVRGLIAEGAIGQVCGASVVFHADKPDSYWFGGFSGRTSTDWRRHRAQSGGGVLIMNLTHYVDLILHLSGARLGSVHAVQLDSPIVGIEQAISVSFTLDNGAICSLMGSAATRGVPSNVFRLWGENGTVELEPSARMYSDRAGDNISTSEWAQLSDGDERTARRRYFERFADAVAQSREPDVSASDALAVQEFVDAAYRSASKSSTALDGPS